MALQKSKTVNGVVGDYWHIAYKTFIKDSGKTSILLRCYVSAAVRATGVGNFIDMQAFRTIREFDGDLTTAECYTQAKVGVKDAAGNETNFFADATDC
jgi:hypothetical protein